MENQKITIFLSHSHKDIDKVRKIRDILEALECEPLIFFLKCLDDKNEELEEFIKEEIKARSIFVYCRSTNSENSVWVKKELDYIKRFDTKRLYTIDIENDFSMGLISFLQEIAKILKHNRIFISYSQYDNETVQPVISFLKRNGYYVDDSGYVGYIGGDNWYYNVAEPIKEALKEGVFIPIISPNSKQSKYCFAELKYALSQQQIYNGIIVPILINDYNDPNSLLPPDLQGIKYILISRNPTNTELSNLIQELKII